MTREEMIQALMSYRDEKSRVFWETMDDEMLQMAVEAEKQKAKQELIDYLATA